MTLLNVGDTFWMTENGSKSRCRVESVNLKNKTVDIQHLHGNTMRVIGMSVSQKWNALKNME